MGTPDFSVPILKELNNSGYQVVLAVTQPDRPKGRKKLLSPPPVKTAALELGIPVFQPEKIRADFEEIKKAGPDLIVTAAYGQLLPKELLELPEYGCINVHASLLPELRGGAPIHYAIMQGKKQTGITIMYMAEKLDAGDIISQRAIDINACDDVGTLHSKLSEVGSDLLLETLPELFAGNIQPIKQDEEKATFASNIRREQERIDWSCSDEEIFNHVRGLRPWPVAFTTYEGQNMKIWSGERDGQDYEGQPGEIIRVEEDAMTVICGNGKGLRITEFQPAGKKRMTVKDYLQGAKDRLKTGSVLGASHE